MTALLVLLGLLFAALAGLTKTVLTGEIRGTVSDRCRRQVDRAAALLPPDLRADLADEWFEELAAFEEGDRLVSAWRFARSLPTAARKITVDLAPAPVGHRPMPLGWASARGLVDRLNRFGVEVKKRWRASLRQVRTDFQRSGALVEPAASVLQHLLRDLAEVSRAMFAVMLDVLQVAVTGLVAGLHDVARGFFVVLHALLSGRRFR